MPTATQVVVEGHGDARRAFSPVREALGRPSRSAVRRRDDRAVSPGAGSAGPSRPRHYTSSVDGHETPGAVARPGGSFRYVQVVPPFVVAATAGVFSVLYPTIVQVVAEEHEIALICPNPVGHPPSSNATAVGGHNDLVGPTAMQSFAVPQEIASRPPDVGV